MSGAYYNEIDPGAAAWLRELIRGGHIAAGEVDERSVEDVRPDDLRGFGQCHFFAGIGGWSLALRRAGWLDTRRVWTGSCPCQPFSTAGKGAGFADERHLWPAWFHLIGECRPEHIFGEQVASPAALAWIDLVHADLEGTGYAVGATDLCAAGVDAPHIRQRLYWYAVADNAGTRWRERQERDTVANGRAPPQLGRLRDPRATGVGHVDAASERCGETRDEHGGRPAQRPCDCGKSGVAQGDATSGGRGEFGGASLARGSGHADGSDGVGVAQGDANYAGLEGRGVNAGEYARQCVAGAPSLTNGFWRDVNWLPCRDGKTRPVEPGTFPLATGLPARVGRLRGYGNAINVETAVAFIRAVGDKL